MKTPVDSLRAAHAALVCVMTQVHEMMLGMGPHAAISPDTAFAIGEAYGTLAKAKALLGRDIDVALKPDEFGL